MLKESNVKVYRYDCEVGGRNMYYAGFYVLIEEKECTREGEYFEGKKEYNIILRHDNIGFTEEMFGLYEPSLEDVLDIVEGNLINQDYFADYIKDCDEQEWFWENKEEFKEWLKENDDCGCPYCGKEA